MVGAARDRADALAARAATRSRSTSPGPVGWSSSCTGTSDRNDGTGIDPADLLARALPLDVAGSARSCASTTTTPVANLLLHHLAHYFDRRLKWALDIRRIVSEARASIGGS